MKIAIRGGHNPGATGARAIIDELTEDRKVKDAVIKYLKELGHSVLDVTPGNCNVNADLKFGVDKANSWGADIFISIHFNKAYSNYNGALGTEVCVYNTLAEGKRIVDNLAALGFKNRGQKIRKELYELKNTKMKSIIVETCFVEATKDVEIYRKNGADKVGKVIAEAIANKKVPAPKPPTTSNNTKKEVYYRVCVGSYKEKKNAEDQQAKLKAKGFESFLVAYEK